MNQPHFRLNEGVCRTVGALVAWALTGMKLAFAVIVALAVAAILAVTGAGGAAAHDLAPGVRTVLDGISPPMPGVTVQVRPSVTEQVVLENRSDRMIEVIDEAGRAFLRIGDGRVEADLADPAWYRSSDPAGVGPVPVSADNGAPKWVRVAAQPAWGWFDHRLHPAPITVPTSTSAAADAPVAGGSAARPATMVPPPRVVRLAGWSIPLRWGSDGVTLFGHVEYRRPSGRVVADFDRRPVLPDGVQLSLLPGRVPAAFVSSTAATVVVYGREGEPFLRIGPTGTEANGVSPTWARLAPSKGKQPLGGPVPGSGPGTSGPGITTDPTWVPVDRAPSYSFLVEQAGLDTDDPPDPVVAAGLPAVLKLWMLRLNVGGHDLSLAGSTRWQPWAPAAAAAKHSTKRTRPLFVAAVLSVVLLAGWLHSRWRRSRLRRPKA